MNNLFLAAYPDAPEASVISEFALQLKDRHGLKGNLVKNLHVTLIPFHDLKDPQRAIIDKVTAGAPAIDMPAFDVLFDRVGSFSGRQDGRPVVLLGGDGTAGLTVLQQSLTRALHKQWLKIPAEPDFVPHMTLLYADRKLPEQSISPFRWSVREFVLANSLVGRGEHEILARWSLRTDVN